MSVCNVDGKVELRNRIQHLTRSAASCSAPAEYMSSSTDAEHQLAMHPAFDSMLTNYMYESFDEKALEHGYKLQHEPIFTNFEYIDKEIRRFHEVIVPRETDIGKTEIDKFFVDPLMSISYHAVHAQK